MVPTASSNRTRPAEPRWQDKVIAGFWLPFCLLFHLWVYFTPAYEEKWDLQGRSEGPSPSRSASSNSFLLVALVVTSVLGFALFALRTLPPLASRILLVLAFAYSFWQFMRPKG